MRVETSFKVNGIRKEVYLYFNMSYIEVIIENKEVKSFGQFVAPAGNDIFYLLVQALKFTNLENRIKKDSIPYFIRYVSNFKNKELYSNSFSLYPVKDVKYLFSPMNPKFIVNAFLAEFNTFNLSLIYGEVKNSEKWEKISESKREVMKSHLSKSADFYNALIPVGSAVSDFFKGRCSIECLKYLSSIYPDRSSEKEFIRSVFASYLSKLKSIKDLSRGIKEAVKSVFNVNEVDQKAVDFIVAIYSKTNVEL